MMTPSDGASSGGGLRRRTRLMLSCSLPIQDVSCFLVHSPAQSWSPRPPIHQRIRAAVHTYSSPDPFEPPCTAPCPLSPGLVSEPPCQTAARLRAAYPSLAALPRSRTYQRVWTRRAGSATRTSMGCSRVRGGASTAATCTVRATPILLR